MIKVDNPDDQKLIEKVYGSGQEKILKFWDELDEGQKKNLLSQIRELNLDHLSKLVKEHILSKQTKETKSEFKPSPILHLPKSEEEKNRHEKAKKIGEQTLRDGKLALFLVAGGQGSRLGYDGPKGCYHVSPVKDKSIFQLHAEGILAMQNRYGVILPWYIMTSEENDKQTKVFFEQHNYFGLNKENIMFFKQGMIPAVTTKGHLILCQKDKIFTNPDGHGGSILALEESGALADMKKRGIEQIFYFQVDNILAKIADPVFIGYHIMENAEMSTKIVEKKNPEEKVGIVGYINNKLGVIEYSYMSEEEMNERTKDGKLRYMASNMAIHMINLNFISYMAQDEFSLPFYKAHKKIAYIDDDGHFIKPDEPNAIKFEKFIFDALKKTTNSITMEVIREEEFAPVKNKEGTDSPKTAKKLMVNIHKKWLRNAGVDVPDSTIAEISPLFALDEEELKQKIDKNIKIEDNSLYLG